tara:strand:- start:504 stop:1343 length:840 start_codon:yes stop_codon:yes gene_type:complete
MDLNEKRKEFLSTGAVTFEKYELQNINTWLNAAKEAVKKYVDYWKTLSDEDPKKWDRHSQDRLWINKNDLKVGDLLKRPPEPLEDFAKLIIGPKVLWPCGPQLACLLPGYPGGPPPGKCENKNLKCGNPHMDGKGGRRPNSLLIGVLISDVPQGMNEGQPLHLPLSHLEIVQRFKELASNDVSLKAPAPCAPQKDPVNECVVKPTRQRWWRERVPFYGPAGTAFVYHGALIHGMAQSENLQRDALYYRIAYPDSNASDGYCVDFEVPVREGWHLDLPKD